MNLRLQESQRSRMMSTASYTIDQNDPLTVITRGHRRQRKICDELECIADQLGGHLDVQLCSSVLKNLRHEVPLYHRDEEVLFNLLMKREPEDYILTKCIELAIFEHSTIEQYAFELAEPLSNIHPGMVLKDVEATGYMLRCCFEITRQHLRWEEAIFLGGRLDAIRAADMTALQAGLIRNRHDLPGCSLRIAG